MTRKTKLPFTVRNILSIVLAFTASATATVPAQALDHDSLSSVLGQAALFPGRIMGQTTERAGERALIVQSEAMGQISEMSRPGRVGQGAITAMLNMMKQMRESMGQDEMGRMSEMIEQCEAMMRAVTDDEEGQRPDERLRDDSR
jgi:hypothetical protein